MISQLEQDTCRVAISLYDKKGCVKWRGAYLGYYNFGNIHTSNHF